MTTTHTFATTFRGHECEVEFNWYDTEDGQELEINRVYPKGRPRINFEVRWQELQIIESEIWAQYRKNLMKDKE